MGPELTPQDEEMHVLPNELEGHPFNAIFYIDFFQMKSLEFSGYFHL